MLLGFFLKLSWKSPIVRRPNFTINDGFYRWTISSDFDIVSKSSLYLELGNAFSLIKNKSKMCEYYSLACELDSCEKMSFYCNVN